MRGKQRDRQSIELLRGLASRPRQRADLEATIQQRPHQAIAQQTRCSSDKCSLLIHEKPREVFTV